MYAEKPLGYVPARGVLDTSGLGHVDCDELFNIPKDFWMQEADCIQKYFEEVFGEDLPNEMWDELSELRRRLPQCPALCKVCVR